MVGRVRVSAPRGAAVDLLVSGVQPRSTGPPAGRWIDFVFPAPRFRRALAAPIG